MVSFRRERSPLRYCIALHTVQLLFINLLISQGCANATRHLPRGESDLGRSVAGPLTYEKVGEDEGRFLYYWTGFYSCSEGEVGSEQAYVRLGGGNSMRECALACDSHPTCTAFDYTTEERDDACRMVYLGRAPIDNDDGRHSRRYCHFTSYAAENDHFCAGEHPNFAKPGFDRFAMDIVAMGLWDELMRSRTPHTIFAPNNKAWEEFTSAMSSKKHSSGPGGPGAKKGQDGKQAILDVLRNHVVNGTVLWETGDGSSWLDTLAGTRIKLDEYRGVKFLSVETDQRAEAVKVDGQMCHGVVHYIDQVLLPQGSNAERCGSQLAPQRSCGGEVVRVGTTASPTSCALECWHMGVCRCATFLRSPAGGSHCIISTGTSLRSGLDDDVAAWLEQAEEGFEFQDGLEYSAVTMQECEDQLNYTRECEVIEVALSRAAHRSGMLVALWQHGMWEHVGQREFTVFVPSDAALDAALGRLRVQGMDLSASTLAKYHIVWGIVNSTTLRQTSAIETLSGKTIQVSTDAQGRPLLDGRVQVLAMDLPVCNGILHFIDQVLPNEDVLDKIAQYAGPKDVTAESYAGSKSERPGVHKSELGKLTELAAEEGPMEAGETGRGLSQLEVVLLVCIAVLSVLVVVLAATYAAHAFWRRQAGGSQQQAAARMPGMHHQLQVDVDSNSEFGSASERSVSSRSSRENAAWELIQFKELLFGDMQGKGAAGKVYSAWWRGNKIAVKVLEPKCMERFVRLGKREMNALSQCRHPNILNFYGVALDYAEEDLSASTDSSRSSASSGWSERPALRVPLERVRRFALVTELAERPLSSFLWAPAFRRAALPARLAIAFGVASGLEYLHRRELPIMHMDLKPGNVLLKDSKNRVCIGDFGSSIIGRTRLDRDRDGEQLDVVMVTPGYVSPEFMCKQGPVDLPPVDVFSLGLILLHLFARTQPGHKQRLADQFRRCQGTCCPTEAEVRGRAVPGVPPRLVRLVCAMLAVDPAARPDVITVREALQGELEAAGRELDATGQPLGLELRPGSSSCSTLAAAPAAAVLDEHCGSDAPHGTGPPRPHAAAADESLGPPEAPPEGSPESDIPSSMIFSEAMLELRSRADACLLASGASSSADP